MSSAGKIVKELIAKNGPMTTQQLYQYVPQYEKEFVSKSHLKSKILRALEGQQALHKKVKSEPDTKPVWLWNLGPKQKA